MLLPIGHRCDGAKKSPASAWRLQVRPSLVAQPGASRNLRPCTEASRHVGQALAVRKKVEKVPFDKLRASGFPSEPFVLSLSKDPFFPGLLSAGGEDGRAGVPLVRRRAQGDPGYKQIHWAVTLGRVDAGARESQGARSRMLF